MSKRDTTAIFPEWIKPLPLSRAGEFEQFQREVSDKIAQHFSIGIDPASGDDSTAIAVMLRVSDTQIKLVGVERHLRGEWEKRTASMIYLLKRAMLPKAKHRSERVVKKMIKRMFPNLVFRHG